jgi:hypothetical protein
MPETHFHVLVYYYGTSSMTGTRRWREMSALLLPSGKVTVYCADGAGNLSPAGVGVVHVPDGDVGLQTRIFAGRAKGPKWVQYLRKVASSCLFWPDRQAAWARKAVARMGEGIQARERHVVVTCGPIFSVHSEMRKWVKSHPGKVLWVMDFRDLWSNEIAPGAQRRTPKFLEWFERRMEQKCHDAADMVTVIGEGLAKLQKRDFGSSPIVLYNGYLAVNPPVRPEYLFKDGDPKRIRYLGTIIPGLRSPALLFEAASKLGLGEDKLLFEFWCNDHSLVMAEAGQHGVGKLVRCHNGVSSDEAWNLSCTADANLILNGLGQDAIQVVTGKVFELMQSGRPAIPITGKESELRQIAANCGTRHIVWDLDTACQALEALIAGRLSTLEDSEGLYSWENTVTKFLETTDASHWPASKTHCP